MRWCRYCRSTAASCVASAARPAPRTRPSFSRPTAGHFTVLYVNAVDLFMTIQDLQFANHTAAEGVVNDCHSK